jgi:transcriptional regulator with XRE-family HTH domain
MMDMTTIKETRFANLRRLLAGFGGKKKEFASKLDVDPPYLSQVLSKKRNIGDTLARRAEDAFGKPVGWMDKIHPNNEKATVYIDKFLALPDALKDQAIKHLELLTELAKQIQTDQSTEEKKDEEINRNTDSK